MWVKNLFPHVREPITPHRVPPAELCRTHQNSDLYRSRLTEVSEGKVSHLSAELQLVRSATTAAAASCLRPAAEELNGPGPELDLDWTCTGTNWTQTGSLCENKCGEEECVAAESLLAQTLTPSFIQLNERRREGGWTVPSHLLMGGRGHLVCKGSFCCSYLLLVSNVCQQWTFSFLLFSF